MSAPGATPDFATVLDHGLPPLPQDLRGALPLPVARWSGPSIGAVTVIEDCDHDRFCDDETHYLAMTHAYRLGPTGWEEGIVAGGPQWPGTSPVAALGHREVVLQSGRSRQPDGWGYEKVTGFAGRAAAWVEFDDGHEVVLEPVSDSGAVVVVAAGRTSGTVRVRDAARRVLAVHGLG